MFVTGQVVVNLSSNVAQIIGWEGNDPVIYDGHGDVGTYRASLSLTRPATIDEALKSGFSTKHRTISSELFGAYSDSKRFKLQTNLTRFGVISYFVYDAAILDEDGLPTLILQEYDRMVAITKAMLRTSELDCQDDW